MDRSDISRNDEAEARYRAHLERSQTVWDRWSEWYTLSERDLAPIREELVEYLTLEPGDRVLDIGCGPGVNFGPLHSHVGPTGEIVGIDYSPAMLKRARERVTDNGWENVTVTRADATTADLGGPYDAAIATLALSIMPDLETALHNIDTSLRDGGELGIVDIRPIPAGPLRWANPLLRRFLRWYANWTDTDIASTASSIFETYEEHSSQLYGTLFVATAESSRG